MTWDDIERMLCWMIINSAFASANRIGFLSNDVVHAQHQFYALWPPYYR